MNKIYAGVRAREANMQDEKCGVCGEPRNAHVKTEKGPLTHPREARGEGTYELVSPAHIVGGGAWYDDWEMPARYKFVPVKSAK